MPALVPREHLPNAITLNTIMFQTASVVGPALAGLVIAGSGVASAYMFNAVSFGFVILALLLMRDIPERPPIEAGNRDDVSIGAAMEGVRFVFRSPLIRSTMLLDFFATFFASATALLPIFAQDILQVGARGYGWLFAAPAVGSFITSIALVPTAGHIRRRGAVIIWSVIGHGVATIVFGFSRSFLADVRLPGPGRRDRHRQHRAAQHHPATRDARSAARPDDRHQHGVLHGRTATRRTRGRRGREWVRGTVFGDHRRHRMSDRHGLGRDDDAAAADLPRPRIAEPPAA